MITYETDLNNLIKNEILSFNKVSRSFTLLNENSLILEKETFKSYFQLAKVKIREIIRKLLMKINDFISKSKFLDKIINNFDEKLTNKTTSIVNNLCSYIKSSEQKSIEFDILRYRNTKLDKIISGNVIVTEIENFDKVFDSLFRFDTSSESVANNIGVYKNNIDELTKIINSIKDNVVTDMDNTKNNIFKVIINKEDSEQTIQKKFVDMVKDALPLTSFSYFFKINTSLNNKLKLIENNWSKIESMNLDDTMDSNNITKIKNLQNSYMLAMMYLTNCINLVSTLLNYTRNLFIKNSRSIIGTLRQTGVSTDLDFSYIDPKTEVEKK